MDQQQPDEDAVVHEVENEFDDDLPEKIHIPEGQEDQISDQSQEIPPYKFYWQNWNWKKFWTFSGPGLLMSMAYLDPGNIESDLQAGAKGGYKLLWILLVATIMGFVLQFLSLKLGVVTGKHLAIVCRENFSGPPKYILWMMTELAIIGSDIQEVVGSAIAMKILSGGFIPLWAGVLITGADTFTFLLLEKRGIRRLEAFFAFCITAMAVSFGVEYFIALPSQRQVVEGLFIPRIPSSATTQAVGIVGAVIMPHNLFLHSALVQSREVDRTRPHKVKEASFYFAVESALSLFVAFIINLMIVSVFAEAFHGTDDADDIGLSSAGDKLEEKYSKFAKYVWAVGILAAGQSSTMTGTYSGQFVMQGFLDLHIPPWKRLMVTRSVAIVPAVIVAAAAEGDLDELDELLNVLQSVQLPFALLPLLAFTNKKRIMGVFVNDKRTATGVWVIALLILSINFYLITITVLDFPQTWWVFTLFGLFLCFYFSFVLYLSLGPKRSARLWRKVFPCLSFSSSEPYQPVN